MPFSSHSKLLSKLMPSHLIEKFNRDLAEIGEISARMAVKKQYFYNQVTCKKAVFLQALIETNIHEV